MEVLEALRSFKVGFWKDILKESRSLVTIGNSELEMALKLDSSLIIGVAPQPSIIPTQCCLSLQLASRRLWQRFGSRKLGSRFVRNFNDWGLDMVVNILRDVQRELVTLVDDREQPEENKKGALNT